MCLCACVCVGGGVECGCRWRCGSVRRGRACLRAWQPPSTTHVPGAPLEAWRLAIEPCGPRVAAKHSAEGTPTAQTRRGIPLFSFPHFAASSFLNGSVIPPSSHLPLSPLPHTSRQCLYTRTTRHPPSPDTGANDAGGTTPGLTSCTSQTSSPLHPPPVLLFNKPNGLSSPPPPQVPCRLVPAGAPPRPTTERRRKRSSLQYQRPSGGAHLVGIASAQSGDGVAALLSTLPPSPPRVLGWLALPCHGHREYARRRQPLREWQQQRWWWRGVVVIVVVEWGEGHKPQDGGA